MAPELMIVEGNKESDWKLETNYNETVATNDTYPQRVFGAGARVGFFALLKLNSADTEFVCRGPVQGFKVLLHIPGEVPQVSKHYLRVPLLEEVLISVKPNMITTSDSLKTYTPWDRQCFFSGERQLRFFKIYTQRNCELECLSNFTMEHCQCVKFSLPSNEFYRRRHHHQQPILCANCVHKFYLFIYFHIGDVNTPICGSKKIACYQEAEDLMLQKFFKDGLDKDRIPDDSECNCLPSCTSIVCYIHI